MGDDTVKNFRFAMGARVALMESTEEGIVVGRADYDYANDQYLVRYVNGSGCQTEQWWPSSALDIAD